MDSPPGVVAATLSAIAVSELTKRFRCTGSVTTAFRLELLKLAKRPVFLLWLVLTLGAVAGLVAVRDFFHAAEPGTGFHGPPGGGEGYRAAIEGQFRFAFFAALLIGATAASVDRSSGVLRELVATGASRVRLFLMRLPAAVVVAEALALTGFAVAIAAGLLLPGGGAMASPTAVLRDGALLLLTVATATLVALALTTLVRSRPAAIAVSSPSRRPSPRSSSTTNRLAASAGCC